MTKIIYRVKIDQTLKILVHFDNDFFLLFIQNVSVRPGKNKAPHGELFFQNLYATLSNFGENKMGI